MMLEQLSHEVFSAVTGSTAVRRKDVNVNVGSQAVVSVQPAMFGESVSLTSVRFKHWLTNPLCTTAAG